MTDENLEKDDDGRTWIHHSVRKTEPLVCLKALLSAETMQLRDSEGRSCLHVAAEQGSVHACRLIFQTNEIVQHQSYIHDRDKYRQTPLHLATKNGHARVLKELLDHGADPYLQGTARFLSPSSEHLSSDIHGISAFDYAQNRGLYFCRSVFEVYSREKRTDSVDSQLASTYPENNRRQRTSINGSEVTPTPPVNGRAKFLRYAGRRSMTESLPVSYHSSPSLTGEPLSRTTSYPTNRANDTRKERDTEEDPEETNRRRFRPPSSTASSSGIAPPIKPRKSSNTPTGLAASSSKFPSHSHLDVVSSMHLGDDDDDEPNSLEGHGGQSDQEENQSPRQERPSSRLSLRYNDDGLPTTSNVVLRRPQHKQTKRGNRHSMYDDYRPLDEEQQRHASALIKSKASAHPLNNRDFPTPSSNRLGSGSGNQSATNRLRSGSKSSSNESIPALDLTVAGQKVFRTKVLTDAHQSSSIPSANAMRPPSGRLKPINSAKSSSSYTEEISSVSAKTLEDVTNNGKAISSSPTKTHLYKKKLAPLTNSNNELLTKRISYRSSIESPSYVVDDVPSDRSEESTSATSLGAEAQRAAGVGREFRSSTGSDKRSKYN